MTQEVAADQDRGNPFKDYDQAIAEVEGRWQEFRFGGEDFKVDLNVDGAVILRWMEESNSVSSIAQLLKTLMDDDYQRLLATRQKWPKYEALLKDLFTVLGGPGNP